MSQKVDRKTEVIGNIKDDRKTEVMNGEKEILRTKIDIGDVLGSGYVVQEQLDVESGEAEIHYCKKNNETFIAKIYKRSNSSEELFKEKKDFFDRIKNINNSRLLIPIEFGMERQHMFEIQHFYKNGTLLDNIDNLTDEFIKNVVVEELNETLHALHQFEEGYSHNDVKPHNIFLTDDKRHIVLGGFSSIINLKGKKYLTKKDAKMTLMYAGPECDETTTRECDYYSFGITLLHLGFRDDPFKGISNHKIRMSRHQYQLFIPDEIDSDLADLIYMLTKYAPFERANYEDVLKWVKKPTVFKGKRNQ